MKETLLRIREEALAAISAENAAVDELKVRYLGKKGELTAVLRGMGKLTTHSSGPQTPARNAR